MFLEEEYGEYKVLVSTLNAQLNKEPTDINEEIVLSNYVNTFFAGSMNKESTNEKQGISHMCILS